MTDIPATFPSRSLWNMAKSSGSVPFQKRNMTEYESIVGGMRCVCTRKRRERGHILERKKSEHAAAIIIAALYTACMTMTIYNRKRSLPTRCSVTQRDAGDRDRGRGTRCEQICFYKNVCYAHSFFDRCCSNLYYM